MQFILNRMPDNFNRLYSVSSFFCFAAAELHLQYLYSLTSSAFCALPSLPAPLIARYKSPIPINISNRTTIIYTTPIPRDSDPIWLKSQPNQPVGAA